MRGTRQSQNSFITLPALICLLILCLLPLQSARAQTETTTTWLVRFQPRTREIERVYTFSRLDVTPMRWLAHHTVAQVRSNVPGAVFASRALADVASYIDYVEPDGIVTGDSTPNDPAFSETGKVYGLNRIEALPAWDISSGSGDIVLAILDTGIDPGHVEFADRIVAGYDFINDDDAPDDDHGHGTHVAGIAAAAADNGYGSAGVCPRCKLMPIKVLGSNNSGTWGAVAAGIYFAVDNGARVINLSLAGVASSRTLEDAVAYAQEHDVIVVAAAGNAGSSEPYYPAAIPWVVAVGATTEADTLLSSSDPGSNIGSNTGEHLDLVAPGYRIYSTTKEGGYAYMTGTSMASPFVAGLAGLVASLDHTLTASAITHLMAASADDLGDEGKDISFGYGRINAYATLIAANGGQPPAVDPEPLPAGTNLYLPAVVRSYSDGQ